MNQEWSLASHIDRKYFNLATVTSIVEFFHTISFMQYRTPGAGSLNQPEITLVESSPDDPQLACMMQVNQL
jgi:hypothetical protein